MGSDFEWGSGSESGSGSGGERGSKFKIKKKEKKDKHKDKTDKKDKKDKDKKGKGEKEKKDKKDKDKDKKHYDQAADGHRVGSSMVAHAPAYGAALGGGAAVEYLSSSSSPMYPEKGQGAPAPPPYASSPGFSQGNVATQPPQFAPPSVSNDAPPSGFRVPLRTDSNFPPLDQTGPPVAYDADGISPVFIGSVLFETSVHPCKIGPHLQPAASVAYGGTEYGHNGRYDLLPFVPEQMQWVHTSYGQIPPGRRPIEGGYEENGGKLYHALVNVNGVSVPGKTGEHLGGANLGFGGQELVYQEYQILCWK